jgi:hypothetical protein
VDYDTSPLEIVILLRPVDYDTAPLEIVILLLPVDYDTAPLEIVIFLLGESASPKSSTGSRRICFS